MTSWTAPHPERPTSLPVDVLAQRDLANRFLDAGENVANLLLRFPDIGTLQADGNTFIFSDGANFAVNGTVVYATRPERLGSWTTQAGLGPGLSGSGDGLVTLDATAMDFIIGVFSDDQNFGITVGSPLGNIVFGGFPTFVVSGAFGGPGNFGFDGSQWHATVTTTSVPEPGALLLVGTALAGLALRRRPA